MTFHGIAKFFSFKGSILAFIIFAGFILTLIGIGLQASGLNNLGIQTNVGGFLLLSIGIVVWLSYVFGHHH